VIRFFIPGLVVILSGASCASRDYVVADADFWRDGAALDGKHVQLVETQASAKLTAPAAQQFAESCRAAEAKAQARFRAGFPQSKDSGKRLGEKFELHAGCTVRMAFSRE
jgi:hypothetical protein